MNICYVILHYKNIVDTRKCINSLLKTMDLSSRIVIVDNGSDDNSGKVLKNEFQNFPSVTVLILEDNIGFSKGNNKGYKFAKKNYNPDFIIIANNDVVFYQNNFEKNIYDIYTQKGFYLLGPDIYIPRHNDHQSPLFKNVITLEALKKELCQYKQYLKNPNKFNQRLKLHAFKNMLCSNFALVRMIYTKLRGKDNLDYRKEYVNVGLQGACLIFSKDFIEKEEKAFEPEPFLYEEEIFLFIRCIEKGYRILYSPKIGIYHEEAASFNNALKNNNEKLKFMLKHHVTAREMLLKYLNEIGEEGQNDKNKCF